MAELETLVEDLVEAGALVRREVLRQRSAVAEPSPVPTRSPGAGDVAFSIDVSAERLVADHFDQAPHLLPLVLVTEDGGIRTVPADADAATARWRVIIDPLDGTRELMYDKRSAWFLAGVAPNHGAGTTLQDIVAAVQVEIPPSHYASAAVMTWTSSGGVRQSWWDPRTDAAADVARIVRPSLATTIRQGYAVFVDFFPGAHRAMGTIADAVFGSVLGSIDPGEAAAFNDQYISTGGQFYLLASGTYRFAADLRPDVDRALARRGQGTTGLCAHPYDLATHVIATALGVILTDTSGGPLRYPLDNSTSCGWIGYANEAIREEMEGPVLAALRDLER